MSDVCTGHCCESFYLPYSYDEIVEKWKANEVVNDCSIELTRVLEMIIPMGDKVLINTMGVVSKSRQFTCRHFNKKTRKCDNYSLRPLMCRMHPGNYRKATCEYGGCTHKLRKMYLTKGQTTNCS